METRSFSTKPRGQEGTVGWWLGEGFLETRLLLQ